MRNRAATPLKDMTFLHRIGDDQKLASRTSAGLIVPRAVGLTPLLLVRGEAPSTASVATTVAASAGAPSPEPSPTTTETTTTPSATSHARDVGALGCHLDVASFEHTLIQNKGLGD